MQELKLEPGVDTLSRWIAHYIAEQIAIADSATGEEKAEAEQRCFESIMKLWQHRYALPNGRSPFQDFTPIFETLQRLNPENHKPFYIAWEYYLDKQEDENTADLVDAKSWLRMALSIDRTARVLVETLLRLAAPRVTNPNVRAWLRHASDLPQDFDVQVIMNLVGDPAPDGELDCQSVGNGSQESVGALPGNLSKKAIEERIKYLETFLGLAEWMHSALQEELDKAT